MPRALALALVVVLAAGACGSRALAGCGPIGAAQPHPRGEPLRVVHLDQTWRSPTGALCIAGIRVYDGSFEIIGYPEGAPSRADPWSGAGEPVRLFDEGGRLYLGDATLAAGGARVLGYTAGLPSLDKKGDLLLGVHTLRAKVGSLLRAVNGPWTFGRIAATSAPLTVSATAGGRALRLYDLVVAGDGFSVGFQQLGSYSPRPPAGTLWDVEGFAATDDAGGTYVFRGYERLKGSLLLYAKFTPAPPANAALTISAERAYEWSGQPWEATLTLP